MVGSIFIVFFLASFASPAFAIDMRWCPEGTKTSIQLNQFSIAYLNNLQAGQVYPCLSIVGALHYYGRSNDMQRYPGIEGVCGNPGPGLQLLDQVYNDFNSGPG